MRRYEEILKCVDVEGVMSVELIPPQYAFYVYQGGACLGVADTLEDVRRTFGNKVVTERVCTNQKQVQDLIERRRLVLYAADDIWVDELRAEYADLNDTVYNICYDEAYEQGHSANEIVDRMVDIVAFARRVIEAQEHS